MSEESSSGNPEEPAAAGGGMPGWVPIVIGLVLVAMGVLAVMTGLRYRGGGTLGRAFERAASVAIPSEGGAPGEPQPGASRVVHGASGDYGPEADPLSGDSSQSTVVIRGGEEGVIPSIRMSAQRAMRVQVEPSDAMIFINDRAIGTADQFQDPDLYEFPTEGQYTIRLAAAGYDEIEYVVEVDPTAPNEIAVIGTRLRRNPTSEPPPD